MCGSEREESVSDNDNTYVDFVFLLKHISQTHTKYQQRRMAYQWKMVLEVEVVKCEGRAQIGWITPTFQGSGVLSFGLRGKGVGDDRFSFSFDGARKKSWHAGRSKRYGTQWKDGDVVGCCVDLSARRIMYSLNGSFEAPMGEIDLSNCTSAMMYLRPAVSSTRFFQYRYLLSAANARFLPPEGFRFFDQAYRHRHTSIYRVSIRPKRVNVVRSVQSHFEFYEVRTTPRTFINVFFVQDTCVRIVCKNQAI